MNNVITRGPIEKIQNTTWTVMKTILIVNTIYKATKIVTIKGYQRQSRQSNKQASKQTNKQTIKQTNNQTNKQANSVARELYRMSDRCWSADFSANFRG
jgi:predicted metalloprotease